MASTQRAYRSPEDSQSTKEAYFSAVELKDFLNTCPPELVTYRYLRLIRGMVSALEKALNKELHGNQFEFYLSQENYRAGGLYRSDRTVRYNLPKAVELGYLEIHHRRDDGQTHHIWVRPRTQQDQGEYRRVTTYRLPVSLLIRWRNWRNGHKAEVAPIRKSPSPDKPLPPAPAAPVPPPPREKPAAGGVSPVAATPPKPQTVVHTEASMKLQNAARRLMEMCGLPVIGNTEIYVGQAILAESKFQGVEIETAAKYLSECVLRDQRKRITINLFYFKDAKWRTSHGGGQQLNKSQQRTEANRQGVAGGALRYLLKDFSPSSSAEPLALAESCDGGDVSDGGQREHDGQRGKDG
jgi:hypothetical protein